MKFFSIDLIFLIHGHFVPANTYQNQIYFFSSERTYILMATQSHLSLYLALWTTFALRFKVVIRFPSLGKIVSRNISFAYNSAKHAIARAFAPHSMALLQPKIREHVFSFIFDSYMIAFFSSNGSPIFFFLKNSQSVPWGVASLVKSQIKI